MKELYIEPTKGVYKVNLQMSRPEVHRAVGKPYSSIRKIADSNLANSVIDTYFESLFQVHYDVAERVEMIELSGDQFHLFRAFIGQTNIFRTKVDDLKRIIESRLNCVGSFVDPHCLVFNEQGLSFWRPILPGRKGDDFLDEYGNGNYFMTVSIAQKNYFSKINPLTENI